jgi:hypothetical protein
MTDTAVHPSTWRRRHGATLVIGVGFLLALVLTIVLGLADDERADPYDPDNPGPDGAQAMARVLDDEGVDVSVVRSADALDDTDVNEHSVVVVTSADQLGQNTLERLLEYARESRLVLVDPPADVVDAVGASASTVPVFPVDGIKAECDDPMFDGLTLEVDSAFVFRGGSGCFEEESGSVIIEQGDVTLFGGGQAMTNDQALRGDNAAVGLRLLGQGDRLVWYVPTFEDVGTDDELGLGVLLPRWIEPGLWVVAIAAVFLIVWRARRLGPLSTEPLPVVVKAIETTRSRGRLYRKAQDRAHAANALRAAARAHLAGRLGLGVAHDEAALIRDLARHVDRPEAEIADLIGADASTPGSDRDLIALARNLTELDREARRT